jgi:hypothetical protein
MAANTGDPYVTAALSKMAILRGAYDVDAVVIDLYASELAENYQHFWREDIQTACAQHSRRERAEKEPSFPSLATLVRLIGVEYEARRAREQQSSQPQTWEPLSQERAVYWLDKIKNAARGIKEPK